MKARAAILAVSSTMMLSSCSTVSPPPNQVVGTWQMVSATIERDGTARPAYGERPSGLLTFTPEMRYVEVLTDSTVAPFASEARGEGTDSENRAAMAGSIGMFGTYTVDENGEFSTNRVEGATFPNWIGDVRTREELRITVDGDRMTENFTRPDGTAIQIIFERVRNG
jgi:hypothetical protein